MLLVILLVPALLAEPCSAAFVTGNNITLERNGMIWNYEEKITGNETIFFRTLIDQEAGNNDGFVNAWEILKIEVLLRDKMEKTIVEEPDVRLNATSGTIKLENVDFWISKEALGKTEKNSSITSRASVTYSFKGEAGPGTELWFTGTPNSSITIILPPGLDAELTEGLNNKSSGFEKNRTVLRGNFGPGKNITIRLWENESLKTELLDMEVNRDRSEEKEIEKNKSGKKESDPGENRTLTAGSNTETVILSELRLLLDFFKIVLKEISRSLN